MGSSPQLVFCPLLVKRGIDFNTKGIPSEGCFPGDHPWYKPLQMKGWPMEELKPIIIIIIICVAFGQRQLLTVPCERLCLSD